MSQSQTSIRATIYSEGTKGLLLINAGGAAAVLTLLQAMWDKWPSDTLMFEVRGVVACLVGVLIVPFNTFLRYYNSLRTEKIREYYPLKDWVWWVITALYFLSLVSFISGMGLAVYGAHLAVCYR